MLRGCYQISEKAVKPVLFGIFQSIRNRRLAKPEPIGKTRTRLDGHGKIRKVPLTSERNGCDHTISDEASKPSRRVYSKPAHIE